MTKSSVGLWWPATFAGSDRVEEPHCTALFLGKWPAETGEWMREDLRTVLRGEPSLSIAPGTLAVTGGDIFGPSSEPVKVLKLEKTPAFALLHDQLVGYMAQMGFESGSEFDWNPHVTVGEALGDNPLPKAVHLGELEVW